jgi:hypothetical protein
MIKAQATINGVIARAATLRTDKEGRPQVVFTVQVTIPGSRNNMPSKEAFVSVSKPGTESELSMYSIGTRVEATGTLAFRKSGENLYLNFYADSVTLNPQSDKKGIEGTLEFRGTIGKNIDAKKDKKGNDYVAFSAFSSEKVRDGYEYTWVRFMKFNYSREDFLQSKSKVEVTGRLSLTAYQDHLSLDCIADEIHPWEFQQNPQTPDEEQTV